MKTQHGTCPIEECRSVKVTGTGIENDCCLAVSFEKKSEAQKIRAIREYFMEIGMQRVGAVDICLETDDDGKAADLTGGIVNALYQGAYRFSKTAVRSWEAGAAFARRDSLTDFGDLEIWIHGGVADTAGVDAANVDIVIAAAIDCAVQFATCVGYARTLGNLPYNLLNIEEMVAYAQAISEKYGIRFHAYREAELKELGCNAILAVNQGSSEEAALVVMEYEPRPGEEKTALVGKGLMFDAGGYHLKSMKDMEGMQYDMCGAANLMEILEISAAGGLQKNLVGVFPLAANLIGSNASKMGDIIETLSGKTVEIYNTDAEGRLVLCDSLTMAQKLGAKRVIDLATLTYSCHAALGDLTAGLFCNDDVLCRKIEDAMAQSGERCWRMPLDDCYRDEILWSAIADLANYAPGRPGAGPIAAAYLHEFIEDGTQWVHLDVVGPAVQRKPGKYLAKGATGVCMAGLYRFLTLFFAKN